jgi:23S rRNA (guanosine2251-2'-O)-methyltransferase
MGAEDTGVSMENLRICDRMVKIPQFGTTGSLNVSVASSVIIYEAVRQRMNREQ